MENKVALITGGSSGIGFATAHLLAQRGVKVVIASRNVPKGEAAIEKIWLEGNGGLFIKADVTKTKEVERLLEAVRDNYGRLDYAVNNAGDTGTYGQIHEISDQEFENAVDLNLKSVFLCMKYELQLMLQQGFGSIVNVSSVKGFTGIASHPLYSTTKHAVHGLTKSAALSYAQQGIRINAVAPAAIQTPLLEKALKTIFNQATPDEDVAQYGALLPMGRAGQPLEVAEAIVWLCSEAASFVTGHILAVDGGSLAKGVP